MNGRTSRRRLLAACTATVAASLSGCIAIGFERSAETTVEETYDAGDVSDLAASTESGDVSIDSADRETVAVRARKTGASDDDLETVQLEASRENGTLELAAERDGPRFRLGPKPRMHLDVTVPEQVGSVRVNSQSGDIDVSSVAAADADTVNGDVTLANIDGDVTAETTNGDVNVTSAAGSVRVETTNGDVDLRDVRGDVTADTTNGDVDVAVPASPGAAVKADTENGGITVEGDERSGSPVTASVGDGENRVEITTTNGDIDVRAVE